MNPGKIIIISIVAFIVYSIIANKNVKLHILEEDLKDAIIDSRKKDKEIDELKAKIEKQNKDLSRYRHLVASYSRLLNKKE